MAPAKGQNLSKQSASTSQNASLASSPPQKTKKSVSFAHEDDYEPSSNSVQGSKNDEDDLPVIASQEAAASAGLSKNKVAPTAEVQRQNDIMTSSFADLTIKPTIVAKDTTKPPPVLTAAERSANKRSRYDVAAEFDGAEPKKVDLSAYLPRQLRGIPIAATFKGKARAMDQDSVNQPPGQSQDAAATMNGEEEYEHDDLDDSDDPDYLDDYDTDEDSDDDNTHIDDILAMREAAMEYHAKRHALGAGTGTGPLGGTREQDAFDEVRTLNYRPLLMVHTDVLHFWNGSPVLPNMTKVDYRLSKATTITRNDHHDSGNLVLIQLKWLFQTLKLQRRFCQVIV